MISEDHHILLISDVVISLVDIIISLFYLYCYMCVYQDCYKSLYFRCCLWHRDQEEMYRLVISEVLCDRDQEEMYRLVISEVLCDRDQEEMYRLVISEVLCDTETRKRCIVW